MKVVKFGGSSLANGPQYQKAIDIIQADPQRKVIVTSAPGRRFAGDVKVTDLLIKYANQVIRHLDFSRTVQQILQRYAAIAKHFQLASSQIDDIRHIIKNLPNHHYPNHDYLLAAFKAHGERMNARLFTKVLNHLGISARFVDPSQAGILVSDHPNDATVLEATYQNLKKIKVGTQKLVFPGFFGFTVHHQIATFARGGSDITGSILARGLGISTYENFTDVDAIYSANPNLISHPVPIKKMTYREMRELSYAGFSVFNDEAIVPAIQGNVTINVKNTNHPNLPGTLIVPEKGFHPSRMVTGVAGSKHFTALYLHKYLLNKQVGFTLKLLQILYKYHVSYEHMPSGIDDLTVIFDDRQFNDRKIRAISAEIKRVLRPDKMRWIPDYAIIMVVGEGMQERSGALERVIQSLADKHIQISMINQGASKISMMLGVQTKDADEAVVRIYDEFMR